MARLPLIAANWKMHDPPEGWIRPDSPYRSPAGVDVIVLPSFLHIAECRAVGLSVGAQWGRAEETGAFTGDISMAMLRREGCLAVLCGHSERRHHHGETDAQVAAMAEAAVKAGLMPIVCVGETAQQREAERAEQTVRRQVEAIAVPATFAYEPVWAISGGNAKTAAATPEDAQRMHAFIRGLLPDERRGKTRILYGGSLKPENTQAILSQPDVDGGLVGGASLVLGDFQAIVAIAQNLRR